MNFDSNLLLRFYRYVLRKFFERRQMQLFYSGGPLENALRLALAPLIDQGPDRVFVIGNGPSLRHQDLSLLSGEVTICSNAFYLMYPEISWRPTVVTVEDPLPAIDNKQFFESTTESLVLIPYDLRKTITHFSGRGAYLNFRRSYRHWAVPGWPSFSCDAIEECFWGGTVSYLSLQIAATLRPREIILLGTDLTYTIPASVKRSGTKLVSTADDPNHFSPKYFGAGKSWHLPEVDRMQLAFDHADKALSAAGISLYNATHGGALMNVRRTAYEELF